MNCVKNMCFSSPKKEKFSDIFVKANIGLQSAWLGSAGTKKIVLKWYLKNGENKVGVNKKKLWPDKRLHAPELSIFYI